MLSAYYPLNSVHHFPKESRKLLDYISKLNNRCATIIENNEGDDLPEALKSYKSNASGGERLTFSEKIFSCHVAVALFMKVVKPMAQNNKQHFSLTHETGVFMKSYQHSWVAVKAFGIDYIIDILPVGGITPVVLLRGRNYVNSVGDNYEPRSFTLSFIEERKIDEGAEYLIKNSKEDLFSSPFPVAKAGWFYNKQK